MKKRAVIGSRSYPDIQAVTLKVNALFNEHGGDWILVSGGADGPSLAAEQTWLEFGGPVISFRPVQIENYGVDAQYAVDEWRMHRGTGTVIRLEPTWADWQSAANYRSMLIAERADEGYAFWDGSSRGTSFEIECFAAVEKPCEVIRP